MACSTSLDLGLRDYRAQGLEFLGFRAFRVWGF